MHDCHPASLPTSLLSNPCSSRLIHRRVELMYFLQRCIIVVCDKVIFDWKETIHTSVIYDDDGRLDYLHHLTIPATVHTDQYALEQADFFFVSMCRQKLCLYLKFLPHQLHW